MEHGSNRTDAHGATGEVGEGLDVGVRADHDLALGRCECRAVDNDPERCAVGPSSGEWMPRDDPDVAFTGGDELCGGRARCGGLDGDLQAVGGIDATPDRVDDRSDVDDRHDHDPQRQHVSGNLCRTTKRTLGIHVVLLFFGRGVFGGSLLGGGVLGQSVFGGSVFGGSGGVFGRSLLSWSGGVLDGCSGRHRRRGIVLRGIVASACSGHQGQRGEHCHQQAPGASASVLHQFPLVVSDNRRSRCCIRY